MNTKEYYRRYLADDSLQELNHKLVEEILKFDPASVFEFGMGTGKNLNLFKNNVCSYSESNIVTFGIDISPIAVLTSMTKYSLDFVGIGDETKLVNFTNFDCVFTCSVLDHVEDKEFKLIITNFKRIAKKAIILAETNDIVSEFYYKHDYEKHGFKKIDYNWTSQDDCANYNIWVYDFLSGFNLQNVNDDMA